ncbi:MAG: hypothetical protein M1830_001138 [Pleopsidium flavum]|nr:MAG: hypothetical protein M1830_001138 [Pleopsidium flavum]
MLNSHYHDDGSSLASLPAELLIIVMKNVPDLPSLMNLILAIPNAKSLYESFYKEIFSAVLDLGMSSQLQQIVHTVMIVRQHTLSTTDLDELFRIRLDGEVQAHEIDFLPDPITTLRDIVHSVNWIEFFIETFLISRLENPGDYSGIPEAQPSSAELHRIRRAFWRLQLYCDLFHKPNDVTPPEQTPWRTQMKGPRTFLCRLCPWEIEELECVYGYMQTQFDTASSIKQESDKVCSLLEIPFLHRILVTPGCTERFQSLAGAVCQPGLFLPYALERFRSDHSTRLKYHSTKNIAKTWSDSHGTNVANAGFDYLVKAHEYGQGRLRWIPWDRFQKWAYCMWDETRLEEWGLLGNPWSWVIIERWVYAQRAAARKELGDGKRRQEREQRMEEARLKRWTRLSTACEYAHWVEVCGGFTTGLSRN